MTSEVGVPADPEVTCRSCQACCCRLEVLLINDNGVPDHFVEINQWGGASMARLEDGWCAALNRNTLQCMIYAHRPRNCREFAMAGSECIAERAAHLQLTQGEPKQAPA